MKTSGGTPITINENNISWQSDRDQRFKRAPGNYQSFQWVDVENGKSFALILRALYRVDAHSRSAEFQETVGEDRARSRGR